MPRHHHPAVIRARMRRAVRVMHPVRDRNALQLARLRVRKRLAVARFASWLDPVHRGIVRAKTRTIDLLCSEHGKQMSLYCKCRTLVGET